MIKYSSEALPFLQRIYREKLAQVKRCEQQGSKLEMMVLQAEADAIGKMLVSRLMWF